MSEETTPLEPFSTNYQGLLGLKVLDGDDEKIIKKMSKFLNSKDVIKNATTSEEMDEASHAVVAIEAYMSQIETLAPAVKEVVKRALGITIADETPQFYSSRYFEFLRTQGFVSISDSRGIDARDASFNIAKITGNMFDYTTAQHALAHYRTILSDTKLLMGTYNIDQKVASHADEKFMMWLNKGNGANAKSLTSKAVSSSFNCIEYNIERELSNEYKFRFKNGIVKITADDIIYTPHSHGDCFHKKDIVTCISTGEAVSYNEDMINNTTPGDLEVFTKLSSTSDESFKNAMIATGYMLKNDNVDNRVAPVFQDSNMDGSNNFANGRSGKTVRGKAVSLLRNVKFISARNAKSSGGVKELDSFALEGVTASTSLIVIEDVDNKFDIGSLYNMISDGVQVNGKGKKIINLEGADKPNIAITSNYHLDKGGNSGKARLMEYGLSDHFNIKHSPADEFGKMLFSAEWTADDYNKAYNFLFRCAQEFLKNNNKLNAEEAVFSLESSQRGVFGSNVYDMLIEDEYLLYYTTEDGRIDTLAILNHIKRDFKNNDNGKYIISNNAMVTKIELLMEEFGIESITKKMGFPYSIDKVTPENIDAVDNITKGSVARRKCVKIEDKNMLRSALEKAGY